MRKTNIEETKTVLVIKYVVNYKGPVQNTIKSRGSKYNCNLLNNPDNIWMQVKKLIVIKYYEIVLDHFSFCLDII